MVKEIKVGDCVLGSGNPFFLIAGPCVIESETHILKMADGLMEITSKLNIPFIFKASYDKANRSSVESFRGPGLKKGLSILAKVKSEFSIPVVSDVHSIEEVKAASEVLDILQIPALLCRQTDFIVEVAKYGQVINIKKGQFMAPWDMENVINKAKSAGNSNIVVTERGTTFGYNNLVSDMRSLPIMRNYGYPVVFDATHAVQLPGGAGKVSSGQREFVAPLARAAVAAGVDGLFMEVHDTPESAMCDGPNSYRLSELETLLLSLKKIDSVMKSSD